MTTSGISTTVQNFVQIGLGVSVLRMRDFAPSAQSDSAIFGGSWERLRPGCVPQKTLFWGPILTGQFFSPENGFNMYSQTWTILPLQPQAVLFPAVASLVSAPPLSESDRHRRSSCTHCRVRRSRIPHSFLQVGASSIPSFYFSQRAPCRRYKD